MENQKSQYPEGSITDSFFLACKSGLNMKMIDSFSNNGIITFEHNGKYGAYGLSGVLQSNQISKFRITLKKNGQFNDWSKIVTMIVATSIKEGDFLKKMGLLKNKIDNCKEIPLFGVYLKQNFPINLHSN